MSPPPDAGLTRRRDGRKAGNPMRAGRPERDAPTSPHPETPRRTRRRHVRPRTREGGGPANESVGRDGEAEPWRGKPRGGIGVRARKGARRTSSRREEGPEADRVRRSPWGAAIRRGKPAGGQGPREGHPSRARRRPRRGKPMDAPTPSGAGRDGGGRREGGEETSDAARGREGTPVHRSGSAVPARVVGRESPGEEASSAAGSPGTSVRGCGDGPL
jgi:hypothetical protein